MKNIKKLIKQMVEEILNEMTGTGAVAGFQTPGAFSKGPGKNKATKYTEKLGFTVVGEVDGRDNKVVSEPMIKEAVNYDSSKDMNAFKQKVSTTEASISQQFSAALKTKLLGKNLSLHGSKGYGQFKQTYTVIAKDVTIEDWYGKDDYQLIITDDKGKQYFVDTSIPIKILDPQEVPTGSQKTSPTPVAGQSNPTAPAPQVPPATAKPSTPLDKAIST